jgi:ubiquinone/menaquinone biosynthesis C-methylase UbiE
MQEWTGERLETFIFNDNTIEHLHRYAVARDWVKGKKVLDIACGEGYGSNLLAEDAEFVAGVDIESTVISKAQSKYKRKNLNFVQGRVEKIPFEENSFDIVVSFETLEHTDQHDQMLSEVRRVLKQNGILVISTPDKLYYTDDRNYKNPFHIKELYKNEFISLISKYFKNTVFLEQSYTCSSVIIPSIPVEGVLKYEGNYDKIEEKQFKPHYLIAIASDKELAYSKLSFFDGYKIIESAIRQTELSYRKSLTYKVGHIILFPFKKLRSILKK